jgi:hypothetical protein
MRSGKRQPSIGQQMAFIPHRPVIAYWPTAGYNRQPRFDDEAPNNDLTQRGG